MNAIQFLSQPMFHRTGVTLLHFIWEALAIAALTAAIVWTLRLRRGHVRYAAYLLALLLMTAAPIVTFSLLTPAPATTTTTTFIQPRNMASVTAPPPTLADHAKLHLRDALPWLVMVWLIGVATLSGRLLSGFAMSQWYRRNASAIPPDLKTRAMLIAERIGLRGFDRIFLSHRIVQPLALGLLRPMILLPASLLTHTPPEMLDAIIAHELAHIRRLDLWVNLLQRVVETLFFYHPAVWWLSRRLREEREICCDEIAMLVTGQRIEYASMLERMARLLAGSAQLAATLLPRRTLLHRIRHILQLPAQRARAAWIGGPVAAAVAVCIIAAIVSCSRAQPATASKPTTNPVIAHHEPGPTTAQTTGIFIADDRWPGELAERDRSLRGQVLLTDGEMPALQHHLDELKMELERLKSMYAADHPKVRQVKSEITQLQAQMDARAAELLHKDEAARRDLDIKIAQRIKALRDVQQKLSFKLRDLAQELRDKSIKLSIDGMGIPGRISVREIELTDMLKRQFEMEQSTAGAEAALSQFKENQQKNRLDPGIARKLEQDPRLSGFVQQIDEIDLKLAETNDNAEHERLSKRKAALEKKADERRATMANALIAERADELNGQLARTQKSLNELKDGIASAKQELGDLTYELGQYVTAKDEEKSLRDHMARIMTQLDQLATMQNLSDVSAEDLRAFDRMMLGLDEKKP